MGRFNRPPMGVLKQTKTAVGAPLSSAPRRVRTGGGRGGGGRRGRRG